MVAFLTIVSQLVIRSKYVDSFVDEITPQMRMLGVSIAFQISQDEEYTLKRGIAGRVKPSIGCKSYDAGKL